MARKKRKKTKKKTAKRGSGSKRTPKPDLTMEQMLERIPDKTWITTRDLQHVINDCHEITIYRLIKDKKLKPYRTNSRGKANIYKRVDVKKYVISRFTPRPAPRSVS